MHWCYLICGASSRKPYNVREKIFFLFGRSEFSRFQALNRYNLPYFIVSKIKKKWWKARKLYGPIQLSKCFSCFWGFYDLRLYMGNVITHHILVWLFQRLTMVVWYSGLVTWHPIRRLWIQIPLCKSEVVSHCMLDCLMAAREFTWSSNAGDPQLSEMCQVCSQLAKFVPNLPSLFPTCQNAWKNAPFMPNLLWLTLNRALLRRILQEKWITPVGLFWACKVARKTSF